MAAGLRLGTLAVVPLDQVIVEEDGELTCAVGLTFAAPATLEEKTKSLNVNRGSNNLALPAQIDLNDSPIPAPIEAMPVPVYVSAAPVPNADCGRTKALMRKAPTRPRAK